MKNRRSDKQDTLYALAKSLRLDDVTISEAADLRELDSGGDDSEAETATSIDTTTKPVRSRSDLGALDRILDSLFDYQIEVVERAIHQLSDGKNPRVLVAMPTGAGKTRTAMALIFELARSAHVRSVLWVAPSRELILQGYSAANHLCDIGLNSSPVTMGEFRNASVDITESKALLLEFGTLQLLHKRLSKSDLQRYDLIVFDEAHLYTGIMGDRIVRWLSGTDVRLLGLTATPGKTEETASWDFAATFNHLAIVPTPMRSDPIGFLERTGVRAKVSFNRLALPPVADESRVTSLSRKSISQTELTGDPYRFRSTVNTIVGLPNGSKTIVFAGSVDHSYLIAGAVKQEGKKARVLTHRTDTTTRQQVLRDFAGGQIDVIVNKTIVSTGIDVPKATDTFLTVPIRSAVLWEQILGRVSRGPAVGGTAEATVWEFDRHVQMHQGVLSFRRFAANFI